VEGESDGVERWSEVTGGFVSDFVAVVVQTGASVHSG